jgi:uncharacterized protein YndB with AHSA1/START domain
MHKETIVIERTFNAPIEKVWSALTEPDHIRKWSFEVSGFKPEVGYEFSFSGGNEDRTYLHLSKVLEVVPYKKIAYSWRYDGYPGDSVVSYELFAEGNKTRVVLTHSGIEAISVNGPDFAKDNFAEGWTHILGKSLKAFVEDASF